jgi:hypothetical protein
VKVSVVIPTIHGREEVYARCRAAYERTCDGLCELEIITEREHAAVGLAWQAGAAAAGGDFIHLGNDDCEPHAGWLEAAMEAVAAGFLPSPQVYDAGGYPQGLPVWGAVAPDWTPVSCALIPFMSREQWSKIQPLFTAHYYTDNFITDRAAAAGWPCVLRTGYAFTHWWAQPGRGAGMSESNRLASDERLYQRALAMAARDEWSEPWPPDGGREPRDGN